MYALPLLNEHPVLLWNSKSDDNNNKQESAVRKQSFTVIPPSFSHLKSPINDIDRRMSLTMLFVKILHRPI